MAKTEHHENHGNRLRIVMCEQYGTLMTKRNNMTAKEYDEMKHTEGSIAFINTKIIAKIPEHIRPFFRLKYSKGTKIAERTANALVEAILTFSKHVNVSKKVTIFIGNSHFNFNIETCGSVMYEQKPEVMATTVIDHNIIFLNFHILSRVSTEVCVAAIIEEFVHAFMDVPRHPLANHIVCLLYPRVKLDDKGEYLKS